MSRSAGTFDVDFETKCARCLIQNPRLTVEEGVFGVEQHGDQINLEAQPVRFHLGGKEAHAGEIAARAVETCYKGPIRRGPSRSATRYICNFCILWNEGE
jgi:hypothetical protein